MDHGQESENEEVDVVDDEIPLDQIVKVNHDSTRIKLLSRRIFDECRKCLRSSPTKILGCLHVFCDTCIDVLKTEQQNGKLLCNVCQCLTPVSLIGENSFRKLIEEEKSETAGLKKVCQSCDDDRQAYRYCHECQDWLCETCTAAHNRVKVTKHHTLTEVSNTKLDNASQRKYCQEHPSEELKLYCHQCRILTCRDCQLSNHAGHKYDYLSRAAELSSVILTDKMSEIRNKRTRLKVFHDQAKKRRIELDKKRKIIEDDIHRKFDQITEALQIKRENFLDRINATFHHKERQLNLRQEETIRLLRAIEHAEQFMACVEHLDKKESTVHTVALSGDYFRLILRQTDCQLESINVDVRLKRPVVWFEN